MSGTRVALTRLGWALGFAVVLVVAALGLAELASAIALVIVSPYWPTFALLVVGLVLGYVAAWLRGA